MLHTAVAFGRGFLLGTKGARARHSGGEDDVLAAVAKLVAMLTGLVIVGGGAGQ
jgi:hypothetical protein